MLWLLTASALAAPEPVCELTQSALEAHIDSSITAIDGDDVAWHTEIIRDLEERLPCLDFVPEPELWAKLLVGIAIVEFAEGGDWENPLATAFHIYPRVDILVGNDHPFWQWTPPESPRPTGEKVPEGVRVYLDGELISEFRQTRGVHLAQRRTGDGWTSVVLHDEPIPESWLSEVALEKARTLFGAAHFTAGGSFAAHAQRPAGAGDFIASNSRTTGGAALRAHGHLGYAVPGGIWWDLAAPSLPSPLHHDWVEAGLFWRFGVVDLRAGASAQLLLTRTITQDHLATTPLALVGARIDPAAPLDLDLRVGLAGKALKASLNLGAEPAGPLRVDLLTTWTQARWDHASAALPTSNLLVALLVGATWETGT